MNWKTIFIHYGLSAIGFISYFLGLRKPKGNWLKVMKPIDKFVLLLSITIPTLLIWNSAEDEIKREDEINNKRYFGTLSPKEEIILPYDRNYQTAIEIGWSLSRNGATFIYNGGAFSNVFKSDKHPYFKVFEDIKLQISEKDGRLLVSTLIRESNGIVLAEIVNNEWKVTPPPNTLDRNYTNDMLEVKNLKGEVVLQVRLLKDRVQLNGVFYDSSGNGIILQSGFDWAIMIVAGKENPPKVNIDPIFVYPSESHLGELSNLNANDAAYWNYKSDALFRSGKFSEALNFVNKAIKLNPYNAQAWYNKMVVLLKMHKYKEVNETFNKAIKYYSNNQDLWYLNGINYKFLKDFHKSIYSFDQSLEIDPKFTMAMLGKAEVLYIISKFQESLNILRKAYTIDSHNSDIPFYFCETYISLGKYDSSRIWIDKFLNYNTKNGNAYYYKGISLLMLGKKKEAIPFLNKSVSFNNTTKDKVASAYFNLGISYSTSREFRIAISYYDSCLAIDSTTRLALYYKGRAFDYLGNYMEAIINFDKAIQLGEAGADIFTDRGISKYKLGKTQSACEDWTKGAQLGSQKAKNNLVQFCVGSKKKIKI